MTELTGAAILLGASLIAMFTTIFKGDAIRNAISYRFIKIIGGQGTLGHEDLTNHYIFIKFQTLNIPSISQRYFNIENKQKNILFRVYTRIIIDVMRESIQHILALDLANISEDNLKNKILVETTWRESEYTNRFREHLQGVIKDKNHINKIIDIVDTWRQKELIVTEEANLEVISYEKGGSIYTKMYTVLHQYALCIEIMVHSGAESFNGLNGELEKMLTNKTEE